VQNTKVRRQVFEEIIQKPTLQRDILAVASRNSGLRMSWLSGKWRSGVFRKCRFRPFGAGDFQGMGVYRPDSCFHDGGKVVVVDSGKCRIGRADIAGKGGELFHREQGRSGRRSEAAGQTDVRPDNQSIQTVDGRDPIAADERMTSAASPQPATTVGDAVYRPEIGQASVEGHFTIQSMLNFRRFQQGGAYANICKLGEWSPANDIRTFVRVTSFFHRIVMQVGIRGSRGEL
jgi:hypothetical protein